MYKGTLRIFNIHQNNTGSPCRLATAKKAPYFGNCLFVVSVLFQKGNPQNIFGINITSNKILPPVKQRAERIPIYANSATLDIIVVRLNMMKHTGL